VIDRLLFNVNSAIFQLYHGGNMQWWRGPLCPRTTH